MVTQGLFKPHGQYVAVKRFRLNSEQELKPGDDVEDFNLRAYHVKSLFLRRIIGFKNSPWANMMISNAQSGSKIKPELNSEIEIEAPEPKKTRRKRKSKESDELEEIV